MVSSARRGLGLAASVDSREIAAVMGSEDVGMILAVGPDVNLTGGGTMPIAICRIGSTGDGTKR